MWKENFIWGYFDWFNIFMNSKITKISQSKRLKASDYEYFGICVFGFSIEV
jgi:hypothetical protein